MQPSDLQKVCQWAKSSHSPSEVYNAACRLLDQVGEFERLRRLEMFGNEKHTARLAEIDRLQNLLHEHTVEVERLRAALAEAKADNKSFRDRLYYANADAARAENTIEWMRRMAQVWVDIRPTHPVATNEGHAIANIGQQILAGLRSPEKRPESHRDARNPQTQGASEADGVNEAQEASQ